MTGLLCTPSAQLAAALAGLCALVGLVLIGLGRRRRAITLFTGQTLIGSGFVLLLGAGGLTGFALTRPCPADTAAACTGVTLTGSHNLLANPAFAAGPPDTPIAAWTVSGTLAGGVSGGTGGLTAGTDLQSARIAVRPGATLCYDVATGGSGHAQAIVQWEKATLEPLQRGGSYSAGPPQAAGQPLRGAATAPAGSSYAQLWLRALDGTPTVHAPALGQVGLRIDPWPNGAQAALAFSFDWESAMGGLIHSKSGHDLAYAETRGRNMRAGADILAGLFAQHHITATFYATGYNLLDGNPDHRQFAGNPTYPFGTRWGWNTDYWLIHPWYSDDPYGTVATDPAWYFGDQTDRLVAAGHEIGSHTFGHLAVRATLPISLTGDLAEWNQAAQARKLPPAHSFAFPWESSNSTKADTYQVLVDHGIQSVTRLYSTNIPAGDYYTLSAVALYPSIAVMPDLLLGAAGPDSGDSNGSLSVPGAIQGRAVISATVARRGVTSFWTHPEELTKPAVHDAWAEVIAAAAAARDAGDLWIAPVSTLVQRQRDVAQIEQATTLTGADTFSTLFTNRSPDALTDVWITLPRPARSLRLDGAPLPLTPPDRVRLPQIVAGGQVRLDGELLPAGTP
ncbi:MAG: polysaccharide deacetylase family protein [Chloroflexota bacterium]|nr:polysaccharide deacetylase family protein [Chloroflexota bacterium]